MEYNQHFGVIYSEALQKINNNKQSNLNKLNELWQK